MLLYLELKGNGLSTEIPNDTNLSYARKYIKILHRHIIFM